MEPAGTPDTSRPADGHVTVLRISASTGRITVNMDDIVETHPDRLLTTKEVAMLVGVEPSSWRSMVSRGLAPRPDDAGDESVPRNRRNPRWKVSTVGEFRASRPGQGRRTDLEGK